MIIMKTVGKLNQIILDILLVGILFFVPLLYTDGLYNSFRLPKTLLFITLCSSALVFAVLVFIKKNLSFWKNYKWPLITLGGFFVFKIVSLIFSINQHISFWGNYSKLEGVLTWTFYILFVLTLSFNFIKKKKRNFYILAILIAVFILVLYGFLQHYGYAGKQWTGNVTIRPIGTLGNPLHLGALMMFSIPIALYGIFNFKNSTAKIFSIVCIPCQLLILIFTKSRSSWATFAIASLIVLVLYLYKNSKYKKWLLISIIAIFLFTSAFIYIGKTNSTIIPNPYFKRAFSILDSTDLSNKQRLSFWKGSWNAFLARPLLGWGDDNLNIAFDRNYPPKLSDLPETRIDRAHNIFLDILVHNGIFAFLFFIGFLSYLFYLSIKLFFNENDKEKNWLGFLGVFFVIGYCLQYFFMYPVISSYIIIFFVFSQVLSSSLIIKQDFNAKESKTISKKSQLLISAPLIIIFLLILFLSTIPRLRANYKFTQLFITPYNQAKNLQDAYTLWPSPHLRARIASHYHSTAHALALQKSPAAEQFFNKAQGVLLKDIKVFPSNYLSYINLGSIYNAYGEFDKADFYFEKATELAPTRHDVFWTWAENVLIRNDLEKAISIYQKAIDINPQIALPYYKLSFCYQRAGKQAEADQYLQLAKEKGLLERFIQKKSPVEEDSNK